MATGTVLIPAPPMPLTPDALLDFLAARGIPATTYSHPPLHTVAQSKVLRGDIPGAHTRNLFCVTAGRPISW